MDTNTTNSGTTKNFTVGAIGWRLSAVWVHGHGGWWINRYEVVPATTGETIKRGDPWHRRDEVLEFVYTSEEAAHEAARVGKSKSQSAWASYIS